MKIAGVGVLAAAMGLTACADTAPVACELIDLDSPPLTCDAAVNAARPRLATTIGVTELRFEYDECAPDAARCPFPFGTAGNVIATWAMDARLPSSSASMTRGTCTRRNREHSSARNGRRLCRKRRIAHMFDLSPMSSPAR